MTEEHYSSKKSSLLWGLVTSFLVIPIGIVLPIPFIGLISMILLYWFYLKAKNANLLYYVLGYFIIAITLIVLIGGMLGAAIIWTIFFGGGG